MPSGDIEVDGEFVGNTPSIVALTPGNHTLVVKKKGYTTWSRAITYSGGTVRLNAELDSKENAVATPPLPAKTTTASE